MATKIHNGKIIYISDGAMANGKGTSGYKIVDPTDRDFYILGSAPCDSNPHCIQSFRAELNVILGEVILSGEILRFHGKDSSTASITTYCDNTSALQAISAQDDGAGRGGPWHRELGWSWRRVERYLQSLCVSVMMQ